MTKRIVAMMLALAVLMCSGALAEGTSVNGDSFYGKSTEFTYSLATGLSNPLVDKYEDVPCLQYALSKDWDPDGNGNTRKISLDVLTPPGGSESDFVNNMISTESYPDVMNIQVANSTAIELYEAGIALDITDYVLQYMPNYQAYFDRHPELKGHETIQVNGEKRYLCLYQLEEVQPEPWGGMMYRRDWIVKYGQNPQTGEAFTGSWDENGDWSDNVVFPSGNTDPVYISDWEWMLEIFQKALDEQGITDGYAFSLGASGENGVGGDFESGFGGAAGWYIDPDTGRAVFGTTGKSFRTYLECMSNWYKKGWIDPVFYEHANDMFFMVDIGNVYGGKVGAWYGLLNSLGAGNDFSFGDETNPVNGIVAFAAPSPINDVYGDDSVKGTKPFAYYANGLFGAPLVITKKAAEKDLPALFTFLDYFYGPEGSLLLPYGLSSEQVAECEQSAPEAARLYKEWGLENGAYTVLDGQYCKDKVYVEDEAIAGSANLVRFNGLSDMSNMHNDYPSYYSHCIDLWRLYPHTGDIGGEVTGQLTTEENAVYADLNSTYTVYMQQTIPSFITGEIDVKEDAAWQKFCDEVNRFEPEKYTNALNRILVGE